MAGPPLRERPAIAALVARADLDESGPDMQRPPGRYRASRGPVGLSRHPGGRVAALNSPGRRQSVSTSRSPEGQRLADSHLTSPITTQSLDHLPSRVDPNLGAVSLRRKAFRSRIPLKPRELCCTASQNGHRLCRTRSWIPAASWRASRSPTGSGGAERPDRDGGDERVLVLADRAERRG